MTFGELEFGQTFQYRGQIYEKESDELALLLQWDTGEFVTGERVLHGFEGQIVVELVEVSEALAIPPLPFTFCLFPGEEAAWHDRYLSKSRRPLVMI